MQVLREGHLVQAEEVCWPLRSFESLAAKLDIVLVAKNKNEVPGFEPFIEDLAGTVGSTTCRLCYQRITLD